MYQEPYEKGPQKFFLRQIDHVMEWTRIIAWSLIRMQVWSSLIARPPTPAAQILVYVIFESRIAMMIIESKFSYPSNFCLRNACVHFSNLMGKLYGIDMRNTYSFFQVSNRLFLSNYTAQKIDFDKLWHLQILEVGFQRKS